MLPSGGKKRKSELANGHSHVLKKRRVAGDFVALPFELENSVLHYVYCREQAASEDEDWPLGRALFMSALPFGSSKDDIVAALSALTDVAIESVQFVDAGRNLEAQRRSLLDIEGLHAPGEAGMVPPLFTSSRPEADLAALRPPHSAVIVFSTASALPAVLKARLHKPLNWPAATLPAFAELHQRMRPSLSTVKAHTDAWMLAFEKREAIASALPAPQASKPTQAIDEEDEGGWTLVKRGGTHGRSLLPTQNGVADQSMATGLLSVHVASKAFEMGAKHGLLDEDAQRKVDKKRKRQALRNEGLYSFDKDQRRQKNLNDMRSKFEAARAQVEERRRSRAFKPY